MRGGAARLYGGGTVVGRRGADCVGGAAINGRGAMNGCSRFAGVVVGIVALVPVSAARAEYAEAPVADGGTLTGKVMFKGAVPAPKTFDFAKFPNPKFCEKFDSGGKGRRGGQGG